MRLNKFKNGIWEAIISITSIKKYYYCNKTTVKKKKHIYIYIYIYINNNKK